MGRLTKKDKIDKIITVANQQDYRVLSIIEYGSGQRDWDLFIITETGPYSSFQLDKVDVFFASIDETELRLQWRDIAFTEPVIAGRVFSGLRSILIKLRRYLQSKQIPLNLIIRYLQERSYVELINSKLHLNRIQAMSELKESSYRFNDILSPFLGENSLVLDASFQSEAFLITLSYALSYFYASNYYDKNGYQCVLYSNLLQQYPLLREVRDIIKSKGGQEIDKYAMLYESTKNEVLQRKVLFNY